MEPTDEQRAALATLVDEVTTQWIALGDRPSRLRRRLGIEKPES